MILANGEIPQHLKAIEALREADKIVCCDGAVFNLISLGFNPTVIVGDLDSIPDVLKLQFKDLIVEDKDEEYNDLQKAIRYCISKNWLDISLLGGFGLREDHALANMSIMLQYANPNYSKSKSLKMQMITNSGLFTPFFETTSFLSYKGQPVSIFSFNKESELTFHGLKYPVKKRRFAHLWEGTLNEAISDQFTIECSGGELLVYQSF